MSHKDNRFSCILYATATCNLQCKYCYIDKTPILKEIDNILIESYKDDYYFNFMKDIFHQHELREIQIWGGEPSYGLVRTIPTILKALDYFPNLNQFMFSTNFTTSTCVDDVIDFYKAISEHSPERYFCFQLQLSLDGPKEINDFNRGEGVTEKFTENFCKFISKIGNFLNTHKNVYIDSFFKPTLDGKNILDLNTKEKVLNYFNFLETYKIVFEKNLVSSQINFGSSVPNTAAPSPHTTEEGKAFANFCRNVKDLYIENPNRFKYYDNIMPFYAPHCKNCSLKGGYRTCGTGDSHVGLLPNRLISGCHNGFVELLKNYKEQNSSSKAESVLESSFFQPHKFNSNLLIFTEKEYEQYEKQVEYFYHPDSTFQISEMASLIMVLANCGQIDIKYKNPENAIDGAHFIQERTSSCIRDYVMTTGSRYLFPIGFIRLFLNGAKEEIEEYANLLESKR